MFRNLGVGLAHSLIAYGATARGLSKVQINTEVPPPRTEPYPPDGGLNLGLKVVDAEIDAAWELMAEPIQVP